MTTHPPCAHACTSILPAAGGDAFPADKGRGPSFSVSLSLSGCGSADLNEAVAAAQRLAASLAIGAGQNSPTPESGQVFVHQARPPHTGEGGQLHYGDSTSEAFGGINAQAGMHFDLLREARDDLAELRVFPSNDLRTQIAIDMSAPQMRALARALLDAAADIEQEGQA